MTSEKTTSIVSFVFNPTGIAAFTFLIVVSDCCVRLLCPIVVSGKHAGSEYGVPLPVTGLIHEMMGAMKVLGRGETDHSAIITLLEDLAKVEVRKAT